MSVSAAVLALAACVAGMEGRSLPGTNPASWTADGWEEFRWGMGPGDVFARARLAEGARIVPTQAAGKEHLRATLDRELYGRTVTVDFVFLRGRLVELTITDSPLTTDRTLSQIWFDKLRRGLTAKYGEPRCGNEVGAKCRWAVTSTRIVLFQFPLEKGWATYLTYADEARGAAAADVEKAEREKL
jgi:hypothetical protein